MNKHKKNIIFAVLLVAAFLSVGALSIRYIDINISGRQDSNVKVSLEKRETEGDTKIAAPGDSIWDEPYIKNVGAVPCYVRVKLEIPEVNGLPMFKVGSLSDTKFNEINFSDADLGILTLKDENWVKKGEYIYYVNKTTNNKLLENCETTPIYSAVKVVNELADSKLGYSNDKQQIIISVQAISAKNINDSAEAWKNIY